MSDITCYDSDNNLLKTLYQWDNNQVMTVRGVDIHPVPNFHFCNRRSNIALVVSPEVSGSDLTVKIPNILLQQAEPIIAYLYQDTNNDGHRTVRAIRIPVIPRPRPDDYLYEDDVNYIGLVELNAKLLELILEVSDVRVGYDGVVHDTAGNAVRSIGEDVKRALSMIDEDKTYHSHTIKTDGWIPDDTIAGYAYCYKINDSSITKIDRATIVISAQSQIVAQLCGICPTNDTTDGSIVLWSETIPQDDIVIEYTIKRSTQQ